MAGDLERDARSGAPACPVIDLDVVASLRRLGARTGRDVLGELMELFVATASTQLETARCQLDAGSTAELAQTAHAWKGSSSVIGARRIAVVAAELEDSALAADAAGRPHAPEVTLALERVAEELDRFRRALRELPSDPSV